MSIRAKLAVVLSAGMALAVAVSTSAFLQFQLSALRKAELEKVRLLAEDVRRIAAEALASRDPLLLVDHLSAVFRDRPELLRCRARIAGTWHEVGSRASPGAFAGEAGDARVETVLAREGGAEAEVELHLSREALSRAQKAAFRATVRDAVRAGLGVVLAGFLLSIPLAWTLTRRIVAIEAALAEIGEGRLDGRVEERGSDEVSRLARGVNATALRLKELDRMKKTFIASVTHELRSPLGAMDSHLRELLSAPGTLDPRAARSLERIRASAARLEHFVTNLLEMSRIERGKLEFQPRMSDLGRVVEDTALFFQPLARDAGVSLEHVVEPGLPALRCDPDLVTQVLNNLISNGLKFTRAGGSVRVRAAPGRENGAEGAVLSVADSGVGMPAEALGRIFRPFERVLNPLRATGAGLGLAIAKSIVDMHGGRVCVESEPGRGTTFRVFLPSGMSGRRDAAAGMK